MLLLFLVYIESSRFKVDESLQEYKQFIDNLVKLRKSILAKRIRDGVWNSNRQALPDHKKYNQLLAALSQEQRELIAEIIQDARDGAIHDTLVLMTDGKYRLSRNNTELAVEPYGTESYYDFVARVAGDTWPDERE